MESLSSSPIHNSNVQAVLELIMEDHSSPEKPARSKSSRSSLSTVITADIELDDAEMSLVEEVDLDASNSLEGQEIHLHDDGTTSFVQPLSPKDEEEIDDPQPKFYSGQAVQLEDGTTAFLHMSPKEGLQTVQLEDGTTAYISLSPPDNIFENFSLPDSCDATKETSECVNKTNKSQSVGSKVFKCDFPLCLKVYTTQHHLKVHRRSHTGDRPYQCPQPECGKTFTTSYSLKSHIRVHTGETPYHCPEELCSKAFKTSGDLQKHIRTHTGERPFVCPFEGCDRSFTTSNIRKVHVRTHTGERPYTCKYEGCGRAFASATNYKNHQRIHTGEKPYMCTVPGCRRRFTEYSSLYKHHVVHTVAKPYMCNLCGKHYRQTSTLAMHKRSSHGIMDTESPLTDEPPSFIESSLSRVDQINKVEASLESINDIVDGETENEIAPKETPCDSVCPTFHLPSNLVLTQPQISMLVSSLSSKPNDATVLTIKSPVEAGISPKVEKGANLATPQPPQQILLVTDPAQLAILQQLAQQAKLGHFEPTTIDLQSLIKATRPISNINAEPLLLQSSIVIKSDKGSKS